MIGMQVTFVSILLTNLVMIFGFLFQPSKVNIYDQNKLFSYSRKIDVGEFTGAPVDLVTRAQLLTYKQEFAFCNQVRIKNLIIAQLKADDQIFKSLNISSDVSILQKMEYLIRQGEEAEKVLVEANIGLVLSMAKKYIYFGMPFPDIIHEGTFGLMKAINKFEPSRGLRLSTYASWWIRCSIQRAISNQSRLIRIPSHIHEFAIAIRQVNKQCIEQIGRQATVEEISNILCIPKERVQAILRDTAKDIESMEEPGIQATKDLGSTNKSKKYQLISSNDQPSDNFNIYNEQSEFFNRINKLLTPEEVLVLVSRYGLLPDTTPMSFRKIEIVYNISPHNSKQIVSRAVKKIKNYYKSPFEVGLFAKDY